jgi:hypothetical protein
MLLLVWIREEFKVGLAPVGLLDTPAFRNLAASIDAALGFATEIQEED